MEECGRVWSLVVVLLLWVSPVPFFFSCCVHIQVFFFLLLIPLLGSFFPPNPYILGLLIFLLLFLYILRPLLHNLGCMD
jgi:hypothetical protein